NLGIALTSNQAQRHAQDQRRNHKKHQFQFLIGVTLLGEQHAPKSIPAREKGGKRGGDSHLQQQREQKFANWCGGIHAMVRVSGNASQSGRRSKASSSCYSEVFSANLPREARFPGFVDVWWSRSP